MEQSNSSKIYSAYLASWNEKHPNIVQPVFVHEFQFGDGMRELHAAMNGHRDTELEGKCRRPSRVIELVDGRAVEVGFDTRGVAMYTVFPSLISALAYDAPQTRKVYFDRW